MHALFAAMLTVTGLPDIASHDWVSTDRSVFLSLRTVQSETSGSAWMFRKSDKEVIAGQGCYSLTEKDGAPLLRLLLCRCWRLETGSGDRSEWVFDKRFYLDESNARGADLEITVTKSGLTLSTLQLNRCNRDGVWTGTVTSRTCRFLSDGEIVKLSVNNASDPLSEQSAPCYVSRKDWQRRSKTFPKQVFRMNALESDWYGWSQRRVFYVLLTHPTEKDNTQGAAWLLAFTHSRAGVRATACRGQFRLTNLPTLELETIGLEFTFRRIYNAQSDIDEQLVWTVVSIGNLTETPGSLRFRLPLTDRAFNVDRQPMFLDDVSYVDSSGKAERRFNSSGFLGLKQTEDDPTNFSGLSEGDAIVFSSGTVGVAFPDRSESEQAYLALLEASSPPGFELRPRTVLHRVARPVLSEVPETRQPRDLKAELLAAEEALRSKPADPRALNHVAWILCTAPDKSLRDGKRAFRLAVEACNSTRGTVPDYIDTLAAACAETGDFKSAIRWQSQALQLAPEASRADMQSRLVLYRKSKPYHQP